MRAILAKGLADLWGRRNQSLIITVTVAMAAGLLYLGLLSLRLTTDSYGLLLEQTKGPHIAVSLPGGEQGRQLAERIAGRDGVTGSQLRPLYLAPQIPPKGEGAPLLEAISAAPGEPQSMGWEVVQGRGLRAGDRGAALLNITVARYFNIPVGGKVELRTPSGPVDLTVVGLAADALTCPYPTCTFQTLYVLPETLSDLTGSQEPPSYWLGLRLANPEDARQILYRIQRDVPGSEQIQNAQTWLGMRNLNQSMQAFGLVFMLAFAIMAVAAALLITANIVAGAVLNQRREIGILKAIGMTRSQVLLLFAGQNGLLALLGGTLGVLGGYLTGLRMLRPVAEDSGLLSLLNFQWPVGLGVVAVVLLLACLVAVLAAWRAVAERPALALRDDMGGGHSRTQPLARLLAALRIPVPIALGIGDAGSRQTRAVLTFLSIALCLVTAAFSASGQSLMSRIQADPTAINVPFDLMLDLHAANLAKARAELDRNPAVAGYELQALVTAPAEGRERAVEIKAVSGNWQQIGYRLKAGRWIEGAHEILLPPNLMKALKLQLGDQLALKVGPATQSFTVVGEPLDVMNGGEQAQITLAELQTLAPGVSPTWATVKLKPGSDSNAVAKQLGAATGGVTTLVKELVPPPMLVDLLRRTVWLNLMMAVIAALSVLNTALLSVREQMRMVGLKKAIGMTPAQILLGVTAGGAWLGLLGAALGVPGGMLMTPALFHSLAEPLGVTNFAVQYSAGYGLALVGLAVALSALAALPAAVAANRTATAQVLAAE